MSLSAWIMWLLSVGLMFVVLVGFAAWLDRKQEKHAARRRSAYLTTDQPIKDLPSQGAWRVGRKAGRTIYLQNGDEPDDSDMLLGMMDTEEIAQTVVDAVNAVRRKEG
jgi:hypothetical protein